MNICAPIKQANDCPHLMDLFHPHQFPNQKGPFWELRPGDWWQPHTPAVRSRGPLGPEPEAPWRLPFLLHRFICLNQPKEFRSMADQP